jgi:hypothetical protein
MVPFGWRVGEAGALTEDPDQQRAIQRVLQLRREACRCEPSQPPSPPKASSYRMRE